MSVRQPVEYAIAAKRCLLTNAGYLPIRAIAADRDIRRRRCAPAQ
jgi:hypothetical protein